MKLRKLCSAALTVALGLSLCAPALAAEAADARLTQVTLAVKATLEVEDDYAEFYGEPNEGMLGTTWSLNWTSEDKNLSVTATEAGKILAMSRGKANVDVVREDDAPHFPAMTQAQAREKAVAFLDRVLADGETAVFDEDWNTGVGLGVTQYGFGGAIYLNGLPTPLSFRVWVSVGLGDVSSFWRGDPSEYVGPVPAPDTVTTADQARALLAGTLDLELIYVRDAGADRAVLRYVPRPTDEYYVDAATGTLVNLTELRALLAKGTEGASGNKFGLAEDAAEAGQAAPTLSPTELEGIAKLEGVLTKEELGDGVKAWTELALEDYELSACAYTVERTDPETQPVKGDPQAAPQVTARLTFNKRADDRVSRRYVTVDARTGELLSMWGYEPYRDAPAVLTQAQAQEKADAFLEKLWGAQYAKTALYRSAQAEKAGDFYSFTYAQKVNGYFFPANTLTVRVSADNGAVTGFDRSFDDAVTFDDAQGLIDLAAARTAWAESCAVELAYLSVPVALDLMGEAVLPLRNAGYTYYNALKPGYALGAQEGCCLGVDAKTGSVVREPSQEPQLMTYDDLDGHWAGAALTELALYQVGWWGGKALPDQALTQLDYVALLASMDGYCYAPDRDNADSIYSYAYRRGILTPADRDEARELTRADMVEMLLNSMGYRTVANLPGIFRCGFADADSIPAAHLGYAALAQGLGLVAGDGAGNYAAGRPATRAEAAVMLWNSLRG